MLALVQPGPLQRLGEQLRQGVRIAMLACARLGAPHSVVFGGFSADALRSNPDVQEFYLGGHGKVDYHSVKHYRRRKRWLA